MLQERTTVVTEVYLLLTLLGVASGCGFGCGAASGKETVWGTGGSDSLLGTSQGDCILCQGGDDEVHGAVGDDRIEGGKGSDVLYGDEGDDQLEGGPGDDTLIGGAGADRLSGGPGADLFVVCPCAGIADLDSIVDFDADQGDVLVVGGIGETDAPLEDSVRLENGVLQVFVREVSKWAPVVRLGPVELSVGELIRRKAIVPRVSVDF